MNSSFDYDRPRYYGDCKGNVGVRWGGEKDYVELAGEGYSCTGRWAQRRVYDGRQPGLHASVVYGLMLELGLTLRSNILDTMDGLPPTFVTWTVLKRGPSPPDDGVNNVDVVRMIY